MDKRRANFSTTDGVGSRFEIDWTHRLIRVNGRVYLGWDEIVDFSTIDNGKEISRGGWAKNKNGTWNVVNGKVRF